MDPGPHLEGVLIVRSRSRWRNVSRYFVLEGAFLLRCAKRLPGPHKRLYALREVAHITIAGCGDRGFLLEFQSAAPGPLAEQASSWGVLEARADSTGERDRWVLALRAAVAAARRGTPGQATPGSTPQQSPPPPNTTPPSGPPAGATPAPRAEGGVPKFSLEGGDAAVAR